MIFKRGIISVLIFLLFSQTYSLANDLYTNPEKFKEFNPDGQKYQFARDYISSLSQLYANAQRDARIKHTSMQDIPAQERIEILEQNLKSQNVNLRVARNLLKRYATSDNGLILKTTDLFMKACDEQIAINEKEKSFLENVSKENDRNVPIEAVASRIKRQQIKLGLERKESSKQFLKASILLGRLLVSDKEDKFGELVYLGITKQERKKLMGQFSSFSGEKFKGKLRQGQSFLEASVSTIRQVLEDSSWGTLDRLQSANLSVDKN